MAENPIYGLMQNPGADVYYLPAFRAVLETYLPFLKTAPDTTMLDVDQSISYRFQGDYEGMLQQIGIPPHLRWITMRVNGVRSSTDLQEIVTSVLVPNPSTIDGIVRMFKVTHNIS